MHIRNMIWCVYYLCWVDAFAIVHKDGRTAFHYAAEKGHIQTVKLLLQDTRVMDDINAKDKV